MPVHRIVAVEIIFIVELFFAGCVIATLGSMTGLGGGFLCVPFLIIAWKLNRYEAVLISLTMILANATSSSISYVKERMIDYRAAIVLMIGSLPALYIGYIILKSMEAAIFDLLFSLVLIVSITYILISRTGNFRKGNKESDDGNEQDRRGLTPFISIPVGFVAGIVSSLFGIGGGAVLMPLMVGPMNMKVKTAIATSMFLIMIITAFRVIVISKASFDPFIALPLALGAIFGAQIGARIVRKVKSKHLLVILTAFLIAIALYMGIGAILKLM